MDEQGTKSRRSHSCGTTRTAWRPLLARKTERTRHDEDDLATNRADQRAEDRLARIDESRELTRGGGPHGRRGESATDGTTGRANVEKDPTGRANGAEDRRRAARTRQGSDGPRERRGCAAMSRTDETDAAAKRQDGSQGKEKLDRG